MKEQQSVSTAGAVSGGPGPLQCGLSFTSGADPLAHLLSFLGSHLQTGQMVLSATDSICLQARASDNAEELSTDSIQASQHQ